MKKHIDPEFCPRCKQLKPTRRDIIGLSWIVCRCDEKPDMPIIKATIDANQSKSDKWNNPFADFFKGK